MPKSSSKALCTLPRAVSLPTGSTPFCSSKLMVAGVGPPSGMSVEYTCHPGSIFPVKTISNSESESLFCATENFTGSCIWAKSGKAMTHNNNKDVIFFILKFLILATKIAIIPETRKSETQKKTRPGTPAGLLSMFYVMNYNFGPASTKALPASLPVNFAKFLMKRPAKSSAFLFHSAASA